MAHIVETVAVVHHMTQAVVMGVEIRLHPLQSFVCLSWRTMVEVKYRQWAEEFTQTQLHLQTQTT